MMKSATLRYVVILVTNLIKDKTKVILINHTVLQITIILLIIYHISRILSIPSFELKMNHAKKRDQIILIKL